MLSIWKAVLDSDGKRVLMAYQDKVLILNTESEKEEHVLEGNIDNMWTLAVSSDDKMALGCGGKTAILWDMLNGKQIRTHKGFPNSVTSVTFSPKGDSYAVCAGDVVTIYEAPKLPSDQKIEEKKESKETAPKEAPKQEKVPNETKPEKTLDKKEKVEQKAAKPIAQPKVLDEKTWAWKPSTFNYAKLDDLVFEVGMGNHPNGGGAADAGIEIENAGVVKVTVDTPLPFIYMDDNSFAGFMVDYHTVNGYTKRVALALGLYSNKRGVQTPIWGKRSPPDQFVDLGKKTEYNLDLKQWAPDGWDGKAWFTVTLQNSGRNTKLKAKAELLGDPIVGRWVERRPGTPLGDRIRTFQPGGILVFHLPKSKETATGTWRREGNKVYFSHPSTDSLGPTKDKWFIVESVKSDELVLVMEGDRRYTWFQEKIDVAQKPKEEPAKKQENPTAKKEDKKELGVTEELYLFNGSNLNGWSPLFVSYTKNREKNPWTVDSGRQVLVSTGGDFVDLETRRAFKDFTLKLEVAV